MGSLWVFSHTDEFSFKFIKFFLIMSYSFQICLKGQRPSSQKFLFLGLKKRLSWRKVLILSFSHSFFRVPFKKSKIFFILPQSETTIKQSTKLLYTYGNTLWRKVKQMQSFQVCIFSCDCFEDTYENAQWRKVKQMQPV